MPSAVMDFTAGGQSTTDDPRNATTFDPSRRVVIGLSNAGATGGRVVLESRFAKADGSITAWEAAFEWDVSVMPLRQTFHASSGFEFRLASYSLLGGSVHARMGN